MDKAIAPTQQKKTPYSVMAERLNIDENATMKLMKNTLMKAKGRDASVSDDELMTFLSIANEYQLNPLSKEIYAFNNRGAIQPIVSIDGWLKIINGHKQFNGMEFIDAANDGGELLSITCRIYRKDRERPIEVTEYMNECRGSSEPWKKWPARMLRHKATIQAARYAFGLSGIIDPDEAERYEQENLNNASGEKIINSEEVVNICSDEKFEESFPAWEAAILGGKNVEALIAFLGKRGLTLTQEQTDKLTKIGQG